MSVKVMFEVTSVKSWEQEVRYEAKRNTLIGIQRVIEIFLSTVIFHSIKILCSPHTYKFKHHYL